MKNKKKHWVFSPPAKMKEKPSESQKILVQDFFNELIEGFKERYISNNPNKEFSYLVDIYTKWSGSYFYFCEKSKSENPNRIKDEFEEKFVRLTYIGNDKYDFSYFRHTGKWHLVAENLTLEECLELIISNPNFHPMG